MKSTPYHAKYYAHCLTLKHPSDSIQKLTAALGDAQVDLNPHQVEAALFAFQSPLKKGAILADEVGLGKTIEAGLVIAQKWAEKSRRILIICPANLRKQWAMEMQDKFFLPSIILENDAFKNKAKFHNPFQRQDSLVICSFQFARAKESLLAQAGWDLAVIDEAHRLRNVYRPDNKIGNSIKRSLKDVRKILLTATPLQNSLSELYGLVSLIDDYAFGDYGSYKAQYSRLDTETAFSSLKARLAPICKRTLRRQVQEYINYTKRVALVEEFVPHAAETELYELVSEYLRRDRLYALPNSQRHLMTLILRKLLASSSFAIQGTFEKLADKLEAALRNMPDTTDLTGDFETYKQLAEQWEAETDGKYDLSDIEAIQNEIEELRKYTRLALSIKSNSKGEKLVTALEKGFNKLRELGAPQKAIIFTESRRTQNYIKQILDQAGYEGKVVLFNGTNNDHDSRKIYEHWLAVNKNSDRVSGSKSADMRQALSDYFREDAQIMIATEAAAEGINLQFCSFVVNYDLPWNPQRIEQRIGRCHRYGQKFDVVVLNFLNKTNAADQRVYRLLDEKFQLFSGVFGASDEILGKIEEGVDFEKRIGEIFQRCRSTEEINTAFDELQSEYEEEIDKTFKNTRKKLLENFDAEVHEKLRISLDKTKEYITKQERWLWSMTKQYIGMNGYFHDDTLSFRVKNNIYGIPRGNYQLLRRCEPKPIPTENAIRMGKLNPAWQPTEHFDGFYHIYRLGHPLAQEIIKYYMCEISEIKEVVFDQKSDKIKPFEGLKQVIYEPEDRVKIQETRPEEKKGYQVIDSITLNEDGFWDNQILLNSNLNVIIGGRSTGKSTLLQCIAKNVDPKSNTNSADFIRDHLKNIKVKWQDGEIGLARDIDFFPQSHMHDIAKNQGKMDELIVRLVKGNDSGNIIAGYETSCSQNEIDISTKTAQLFQLQSKILTQAEELKDKGDKKGIEFEITSIETKINNLKIDNQITDEELGAFKEFSKKITELEDAITRTDKDSNIVEGLEAFSIFNNDIEAKFNYLSDSQKDSLLISYNKLKTDALNEWAILLGRSKENLIQNRTNLLTSIETLKKETQYQKGVQYVQGNKEFADLQSKLESERKRLAQIIELEKTIKEEGLKKEQLKKTIVDAHYNYFSVAAKLVDSIKYSFEGIDIKAKSVFRETDFSGFLDSRHNQRGYERQGYLAKMATEYPKDPQKVLSEYLDYSLNNQIDYKGGHIPVNVTAELLSTNWFDISYDLSYQNDLFNSMSQGKQAFVVLKLLLEFSDKKCPILIDQPEDSLDNRAIYNELVTYIKSKKKERQIVLVTHNPNVVVGADAEQVIVANQQGKNSPNKNGIKFQYVTGSLECSFNVKGTDASVSTLESKGIRQHVCEILEGGVEAFRKREEKYNLQFQE